MRLFSICKWPPISLFVYLHVTAISVVVSLKTFCIYVLHIGFLLLFSSYLKEYNFTVRSIAASIGFAGARVQFFVVMQFANRV